VDIGAVHPTFSGRVGDRSPRRVDPTLAVVRSSSSTSTSSDPKLKPKPKPKPKVPTASSADSRVKSAPTVKAVELTYPDPFAHPLQPGCEPKTPDPNLPGPRRLDWIADPLAIADEDWPVNCEGHTTLCDILRKTAIDREVLAAVADSHAPGIYEFVDGIKRLGVENFMIIALDDALHARLTNQGVAAYRVNTDAQGSHKISAQKFGIIKEFVERGCSVLLTDTDVAWMRDPFPFLYRDADVESMSDGWDNSSAHGFLDTVDDPAMGPDGRRRARAFRVAALNSGMWYVSATEASRRLMGKFICFSILVWAIFLTMFFCSQRSWRIAWPQRISCGTRLGITSSCGSRAGTRTAPRARRFVSWTCCVSSTPRLCSGSFATTSRR
jgi:hypothetical protein